MIRQYCQTVKHGLLDQSNLSAAVGKKCGCVSLGSSIQSFSGGFVRGSSQSSRTSFGQGSVNNCVRHLVEYFIRYSVQSSVSSSDAPGFGDDTLNEEVSWLGISNTPI